MTDPLLKWEWDPRLPAEVATGKCGTWQLWNSVLGSSTLMLNGQTYAFDPWSGNHNLNRALAEEREGEKVNADIPQKPNG